MVSQFSLLNHDIHPDEPNAVIKIKKANGHYSILPPILNMGGVGSTVSQSNESKFGDKMGTKSYNESNRDLSNIIDNSEKQDQISKETDDQNEHAQMRSPKVIIGSKN